MTLVYAFVDSIRHIYPVQVICAVLGVNRSCFYAWSNKTTHQPNARHIMIEQQVIAVFKANKRGMASAG